jgi:hypothetical protein
MSNSGKTTLRCTDRLEDEDFVKELREYFFATPCGKVFIKATGEECRDINKSRYLGVGYKGRYYMKHRLVYALLKGPFHSHLDHIDRDRYNNSITNLRPCTQGLNVANASIRSDNTSGYIGVIWHKATNKWQAQTMYNGKRVHIGLFESKDEAALAYNYKLTELFGHQCTFNQVF